MEIKQIQIDQIKPYEKNAKKHPKKQIEQVAASIKEFGFKQPVVLDKDFVLIVGHGRVEAAKTLGIKEVPAVIADDLTPEQIKAYRLADNKLNESDWDMDLVIEELKDLSPELLDLTGFEKDLILEPDEKDDLVPEVPEEPKAKLGDIYQLGKHRVMCGDSTKIDDVEKLMDGQKADMVFTSPPYNANTKTGQGDIFNRKAHKKLYAEGYSDNLPSDEYVKFSQSVLDLCFAFTSGFIFWNVSYNKNSRFQYIQQITPYLEYLIEQIAWKKSSAIPFKGSMRRAWEPIYLFSTQKVSLGLEQVETNVWEVSNADSQTENHKACFPVALVVKGINLINGAEIILDPFLGSGSTLIACEKTNRICYGMELDPKYISVVLDRWEDYANGDAIRLSDGKKWKEIKKELAN
jgi:DNA modification methylase